MLVLGVWGSFEQTQSLVVTPEGTLLIPTLGEITVGGKTLAHVKEELKAFARGRYPNTTVTMTLVGMRRFKVPVGGGVAKPGTYEVSAAMRVSEAIQLAGGIRGDGSLRRIELTRSHGERFLCDLFRVQQISDSRFNPRLREGDRIVVPARSYRGDCTVSGAVGTAITVEYREDDSLLCLLALAGGLTEQADSSRVEITRLSNPHGPETFTIDLRAEQPDRAAVPGDVILVRTNPQILRQYAVWVSGEVVSPGSYVIDPGQTKLSEVIQRAGGFTPRAALAQAAILRPAGLSGSRSSSDTLPTAFLSQLSPEEIDYYKTRVLLRPGQVSCDFVRIFERGDLAADVIVQEGDYITVPSRSPSVYVTGRIAQPGFVAHEPDRPLRYYIERAGGYSWNADPGKARVIKGVSGAWQKASPDTRVDAGDTIWIPEKKKQKFLTAMRDNLLLLGNLTTIYLVVKQATK